LQEARRKSQDAIRIADMNLGDPLDPGKFNSEIFSAAPEKSLNRLPKNEAPPEPSTADMLRDIMARMSGVKKRKPPTTYH
jgi:hypothetical protein